MYEDIAKEVEHYTEQLKGKVIYCNADSEHSNFYKYFTDNFDRLELKSFLICDKDFRSDESIDLLKQADVVITNPPFSLFREYVTQLKEHEKDYLIIGNYNAVAYRDYFPLVQSGKVKVGYSKRGMKFVTPDGVRDVNAKWFTTLDKTEQSTVIETSETYNEKDYPAYENYNAIEVSRVKDIPKDYLGVMGVPVTYLEKHNERQFNILGISESQGIGLSNGIIKTGTGNVKPLILGKEKYTRVFIQRIEG